MLAACDARVQVVIYTILQVSSPLPPSAESLFIPLTVILFQAVLVHDQAVLCGPVSSPERSFQLRLAAMRIVVVRRGPTRHEFAERAAAVPGDWAQWGGRGLRG